MKKLMIGLCAAAVMLALCGCDGSGGSGGQSTPEEAALKFGAALQKGDVEAVLKLGPKAEEALADYRKASPADQKVSQGFVQMLGKKLKGAKLKAKVLDKSDDQALIEIAPECSVKVRKVNGKWYASLM